MRNVASWGCISRYVSAAAARAKVSSSCDLIRPIFSLVAFCEVCVSNQYLRKLSASMSVVESAPLTERALRSDGLNIRVGRSVSMQRRARCRHWFWGRRVSEFWIENQSFSLLCSDSDAWRPRCMYSSRPPSPSTEVSPQLLRVSEVFSAAPSLRSKGWAWCSTD